MTTSDNPLVSIVTPSYNHAKYIEQTLLSVKNQDYPNIEHIVCDGASRDNTSEILKSYEAKYNLRWISEPDRGQSEAINKGFRMARGEVIGWLPSDDVYFDRQVVSYVVAQFRNYPEVEVIYGNDVSIDTDNNIFRIRRVFDWDYNRLLRGQSLSQPATFFRGEVVRQNKLDESLNFCPDFEFWLRLGKSYHFKHVNRILAGNRVHRARKRIAGRSSALHEDREVLKKYGQKFGLTYYLLNYLVYPAELTVRRVRLIPRILMMERRLDTLAFDARCRGQLSRVFTQVAPASWFGL